MAVIRTSIPSELLKRRLLIGNAVALPGIGLMVGANFLAPSPLAWWGVPIAFISILLIALGLIPYRRLTRLQLHPDKIEMEREYLIYHLRERPRFRLARSTIKEFSYIGNKRGCGVGVKLHSSFDEKIAVIDPRFDMQGFLAQSQRRGYDLFFPFFSARAALELRDWLYDA